jgi:hypothetical protein
MKKIILTSIFLFSAWQLQAAELPIQCVSSNSDVAVQPGADIGVQFICTNSDHDYGYQFTKNYILPTGITQTVQSGDCANNMIAPDGVCHFTTQLNIANDATIGKKAVGLKVTISAPYPVPVSETTSLDINVQHYLLAPQVIIGGDNLTQLSNGAQHWQSLEQTFSNVTYVPSKKMWLAVTEQGSIMQSLNKVNWAIVLDEPGVHFNAIAANPDATEFMAVANNNVVYTSTDAEHWTENEVRDQDKIYNLSGVTWNDDSTVKDFLVAGYQTNLSQGERGVVLFYQNQEWRVLKSDSKKIFAITYDAQHQQVYAAAQYGTVFFAGSSLSGLNGLWGYDALLGASLTAIAAGDNKLLAVGSSAGMKYGLNESWTSVPESTYPNPSAPFSGVVWTGDSWLVTGADGQIWQGSVAGDNDWTWQLTDLNTAYALNGIACSELSCLAVGKNALYSGIRAQLGDEFAWQQTRYLRNTTMVAIAGHDTTWIMSDATGALYSSNEGFTWQKIDSITTPTPIKAIAWLNGKWIAVGNDGYIITSSDGIDWTQATVNLNATINSVAYGDDKFVAVGSQGSLWISDDGIDWTGQTISTADLNSVVFTGTKFIAIGQQGTMMESADGLAWTTEQNLPSTDDLTGIATNGHNIEVAVGANGTILTSTSNSAWHLNRQEANDQFTHVRWDAHVQQFIAVGRAGLVMTSFDGTNWHKQVVNTDKDILAVGIR